MRLCTEGSATDAGTRVLLRNITKWLQHVDVPVSSIATVELVLAEAINNIVEHAYTGTAKEKLIRAELSLIGQQLDVALCDNGVAFPDGMLPSGELPDLDVALEQLPEGGFGWFLIYTQTQSVHYSRRDDRNTLSLCFELDRNLA